VRTHLVADPIQLSRKVRSWLSLAPGAGRCRTVLSRTVRISRGSPHFFAAVAAVRTFRAGHWPACGLIRDPCRLGDWQSPSNRSRIRMSPGKPAPRAPGFAVVRQPETGKADRNDPCRRAEAPGTSETPTLTAGGSAILAISASLDSGPDIRSE